MYTATMVYQFKDDFYDQACILWEKEVFEKAKNAPGLIRMQFLLSRPKAMAIGTWKDKKYAQEFMQTGIFTELMNKIRDMLDGEPAPELWDLKYFFNVHE